MLENNDHPKNRKRPWILASVTGLLLGILATLIWGFTILSSFTNVLSSILGPRLALQLTKSKSTKPEAGYGAAMLDSEEVDENGNKISDPFLQMQKQQQQIWPQMPEAPDRP